MKKENVFKRRVEYYRDLVLQLLVLAMSTFLLTTVIMDSEEELIRLYGDQKLIGSSNQRGAQAIQMFIVNNFGKPGMLSVGGIAVLLSLHYLIKKIKEFRRFLRKDKLYKQGLVSDLIDDYESIFIWKRIKKLFVKKSKTPRRQYPSEKEIQESLKNNKYCNK